MINGNVTNKEEPRLDTAEPIRYKYLPEAASAVLASMVATARQPSGPRLWSRAARRLWLALPTSCFRTNDNKVEPSISNYGSSRCYSNSFMVRCHGVEGGQ